MNEKKKIVFWLVFILFISYFLCCLPTYVSLKYLSYPYAPFPILWDKMFIFMFRTQNVGRFPNIIRNFSYSLTHKIPDWTMPIAIVINVLNMAVGFMQHKKRWWYYLILMISIFFTVILIDCYKLSSSLE